MANISSAFGTLTMSNEVWNGIASTFRKFIEDYTEPYYGVTYWNVVEGNCETAIQFAGSGRWAFDRCVEETDWFFYTEKNPLGQEIIDYLVKCGSRAAYIDFTDEEGGCEVLYQACGDSYVNCKGGLSFGLMYRDYEYTARNLLKIGVYDEYYEGYDTIRKQLERDLGQPLTDEMWTRACDEISEPYNDGILLPYRYDDLCYELRCMA